MPSHPGKGHAYPYFKVQAWDPRTLAWRDHRKEAFDDEEAARTYRATIDPTVRTRLVRWDRTGSTPMQDVE
jgi:hypothetical protein